MSTLLSLARIAVAALALGAVSNLHATPMVFFGENPAPNPEKIVAGDPLTQRNEFLLNLIGIGTETFDTRNVGDDSGLAIDFVGSGTTGVINGAGQVQTTSDAYGRFDTTGTAVAPALGKWWDVNGTFTITFSQGISAFGFYGTDVGDFEGQVTVALFANKDDNNAMFETTITSNSGEDSGSLLFWGFFDTAQTYKKISFGNTNEDTSVYGDYFGFDDMVVGDLGQINRVPEPATLALAGLGLIGLAATRRKQRH